MLAWKVIWGRRSLRYTQFFSEWKRMENAHNGLLVEINTILVEVVVVDKWFQVILQKTEHYCVYHHHHQVIPRLASHSGLGILTVVFRKVESIPINIGCPRILCLSWPTPSPSENPPLPHTFPAHQLPLPVPSLSWFWKLQYQEEYFPWGIVQSFCIPPKLPL